jgi:uncharacterized protein YoxC
LSINPHDIDDSFSLIDKAIEPLIEKYKNLGAAAKEAGEAQKAAAAQEEYAKTIEDLRKKIDDFGKSESQLAHDAAVAAGALSEQAEEVKKLMDEFSRTEILADYRRQIDEFSMSQEELARAALKAAGANREELDSFDAMVKELKRLKEELDPAKKAADDLKKAIDGIRDSFINLGANAALGGIEKLGSALGQGADAGKAMSGALAAMSQEILNALPNLFLQAGLQLIAQGQWALGLGFAAAAGSSALIKGYAGGKIESERAAANAHGNIFDSSGAIPYAPTYFRHGGEPGLMGEAGPEAVVPLKAHAERRPRHRVGGRGRAGYGQYFQ